MDESQSPDLALRAQLIVVEQVLGLMIKQLPSRDRDFIRKAIVFRKALFEDAHEDPGFGPDLTDEDRVRLSECVQERWKVFNEQVLEISETATLRD